MKIKREYKNFIFDLYGTLVDIRTNEWSAYLWKKMQEFYAFHGAVYTPIELKKGYFRISKAMDEKMAKHTDYPEIQIEYVFKELFKEKGIKIDINTCRLAGQFFRIISTKYVKVYDDAFDTLHYLKEKGKKIYLLSNAQQIFTEYEIKYVGLYEEFDGICLSSDEGCRKPSSKFFDVVFDRYDLKKEESVMIGNDWTTDIEGANVYGIDSVYLHTEISPRDTILEKVNATYVYPDGKLSNLKKLV